MSAVDKAVAEAIAKRIAEMTVIADAGKAEEAQLEAMLGWQAVPADITDDQMAMIAVIAQGNPMVASQMNQDVLKSIFGTLNDISKNDQPRIQSIMQKAQDFQSKERLQPGISLQVVTERVGNAWAAAAVLIEVDEDMNVKALEKLDSDLYLGMYVTPRANRSLTDKFNMDMTYTAAGQTLEPVTIVSRGDGAAQIHVRGHMQAADGRQQPIAVIVPVNVPAGPMVHPVKPGNPAP
jgi:hypothetical protein